MLPTDKPEIGTFRGDYAKHADFCEALQKDMKTLYLLVFLLTANHNQAERCFTSTVEESFKGQFVFKEFVRTWIKQSMIRNAIGIVSPATASSSEHRDLWGPRQQTTHEDSEINVVIHLLPLERFVFVMTILERYSVCECSLLLACSTKEVAQAQWRALSHLPALTLSFRELTREYCG